MTLHGSNLQFLHIPKHAGTVIEVWAAERGYKWGSKWLQHTWLKPASPLGVSSLGVLFAPWHVPGSYFETDPYNGFDVFLVVRNPYEHMISEFRCPWFGFKAQGFGALRVNLGQSRVLEWMSHQTLESVRANATADDLNEWIQRYLAYAPPWWWGHIPQHTYVEALNKTGALRPENVLRMENIANDFQDLVERYGLEPGALPEEAKSSSSMPTFSIHDLTETTRRMIEEHFGKDFEMFHFEKAIPVG
eukprot:CAMPEP_0194485732 /NCGR_PEP_ID=MMETSP0253-20130528/6624_1 /TAXON_ID=2966 /ORGANISM="Noctiluca scintillans" /LENGTH=246 /DNA_ID=CAMNT_0039325735 /DNA_START=159 /DNA_END=899 /DNA_ORIENTATION=-